MKRLFFVAAILLAVSAPAAFGQFRLELGAEAPLGIGYLSGSASGDAFLEDTFSETGIIPIPTAGLYLQADLAIIKIAAGVKLHSAIIATGGYPNLLVELALGPLAVEAGLGGYYFGFAAAGEDVWFGQMDVLLPEVSAWLALGKRRAFRIGAGAIGLMGSELGADLIPFIYYAGLKVVLD
ncbi:MAG: hypothetical protein WAZ99_06940 [Rectinemataceae bacterium]